MCKRCTKYVVQKKKHGSAVLKYSLLVQKVQLVQQLQSHQRVPVGRIITSLNENVVTEVVCGMPAHPFMQGSIWCLCAVTHRRSRHSLETRMSTETLQTSLSPFSSNTLLASGSSRSL